MMNNLQSSALVAKNLLNVLQGYTKGIRFVAVLTMLLTVGIGSAWGATVTYTVSSTTSVTKSGTAPIDATASYNQTYSTAKQLTKNNSATLTLTKLGGINISNLTLSMKSNGSGGSGKLSYSIDGGSTWTYLVGSSSSGLTFSHANWNGNYTTSYTNISKDVTINNATQLKIKIEATANSLYCESYTITYTDATPKQEYTLSYQAGENNGTLPVEEGANLLDALGELDTPTSCDATSTTFVGWTAKEITEKTNTAPTFITSTDIMPSSDYAVHAVFAREETTEGGMTTTTFTAGTDDIATGKNGIKFTMSNTTGSGGYYQVYSGSAMTINSDNPITSFIITCTASGTTKYGPGNITFKTGSYSYSGTNGTWTGNSKSVESNNSSAQLRITKIVVTTSGGTTTTYFDYITSCTTQTVSCLHANA